jgi:hypothetical protein
MADEGTLKTTSPRKRISPNEAEALVAMMNKSIDVARLQFKRLRKDLDDYHQLAGSEASVRVFDGNIGNENMSRSRETRTALFADVHFLLISLHETEQLFSRLKKLLPHETELANLHNRHRPMMRRCSEFRVHMEHVDGKETEDLGKLAETVFTLRGKGIDLGPALEKGTEALFSDLVSAWARISERQRKIRELIVRSHPAG